MVSEGKGTGSTFYVELPLYRKTDLDDSRYDNSEMSGRSLASLHSIFIPSKLARESSKKFAAMIRASSARSLTIHPRSGAEIKPFSPLKKNKPPTVDILTLDDRMELGEAGGEDSKPVFTPQQEDERITSVVNLINNAFTTALRDGNGMEAKLSSKFRRNSSMAPKLFKILLVDDSVPNRKMLSRLLQREGHTVIEVGDGTEAVEVVRNKMNEIIFLQHGDSQSVTMNLEDEEKSEHNSAPFDFILMDYFMIKMNGPEAAREIRKLGYKNPIIGVTGVVGDDSVEFVKAGADLVLSKPVTVLSIWKGLHSLDFF